MPAVAATPEADWAYVHHEPSKAARHSMRHCPGFEAAESVTSQHSANGLAQTSLTTETRDERKQPRRSCSERAVGLA
jgi:hypothetical protein